MPSSECIVVLQNAQRIIRWWSLVVIKAAVTALIVVNVAATRDANAGCLAWKTIKHKPIA